MDQDFLMELLCSHGVSGRETEIEKKVYDRMLPIADQVTVDELGNVTAAVNPAAQTRILLTGHADEIGLMVTEVTGDGFLKVTNLGGIYTNTYLGQKVRIHTERGTVYGGVINTRSLSGNKELRSRDLTVDIGARDREDALKAIALGDPVTFDTDVRPLLNGRLCGRAMDDRLGVFIAMEALKLAKEWGLTVGAYAAATTCEETVGNGAYFTASRVKPALAIAVDVTYAGDYPGAELGVPADVALGKGPVLCNAPGVHRGINRRLEAAAARQGIPIQYDACSDRTGTDGDIMHRTGLGVPFALVSIPLRYMHNPDEVCDTEDIRMCVELLARFLCDCEEGPDLRPF